MTGIVVVLSGFPRRSETFAVGELSALARSGMLMAVFSTKPGDGLAPSDEAGRLSSWVTRLPDGQPATQAAALLVALGGRRPAAIHGYFAHTPTEVASLAAARLGVRFGFSVHARDARKVTVEALRARAAAAACVITCNRDAKATLLDAGVAPRLVPHGVDLARFQVSSWPGGTRLHVLAVGRLVKKKGFDVLLRALSLVPSPWHLTVAGDGPERAALTALSNELGLTARVTWRGAVRHDDLPAVYREAHVVAVPSVVDASGDRDGLPNVVLEAMASERLVIGTPVGAICSAVRHDETGWIVAEGDVAALADRLDLAARTPRRAAQLAALGRAHVERHFEGAACARRFTDTLAACYA